jgi:hypothetical protein
MEECFVVGYKLSPESSTFSSFVLIAVFGTRPDADLYVHRTTQTGSRVFGHLPLEVLPQQIY